MGVSKVIYGNQTLMDLTGDTVVPEVLLEGFVAHGADGTSIVGTYSTAPRVKDVSNASVTAAQNTATITWTDPDDLVIDNVTEAEWAGTKVVRKEGSAPAYPSDGTLVVNSTTKDAYSVDGYEDTGLTYGSTYYYRFFTYTEDGAYLAGITISVSIARIVIPNTPSQSGSLTYNGSDQTPTFNNYSTDALDISGTTSATNAGTYTATFTPKEGYCWSDQSLGSRNVSWSIGKAANTITLNKSSVTLQNGTTSTTVTASGYHGTLAVSSSDTTVVTASVSGSTITITSPDSKRGSATITVSVPADTNYNAGSATISVTAKFVKIVTWADGTNQEIADMVDAADHGEIDLTTYWNVGDVRSVNLSAMSATGVGETHAAQTVQLVLVAKTTKTSNKDNPCWNYQYVNPISGGRSYPSFIVQALGLMYGTKAEPGYMHGTNDASVSWNNCARKTWCDNVYRNAIPSKLRSIFKQVVVKYSPYTSIGSIQTCNGYFFFPAEMEVFGTKTYGGNIEANNLCYWPYYSADVNRRKKYAGSTYAGWWTRTKGGAATSTAFLCVSNAAGTSLQNMSATGWNFAPAACI